jgi:hypothetical protein
MESKLKRQDGGRSAGSAVLPGDIENIMSDINSGETVMVAFPDPTYVLHFSVLALVVLQLNLN